MKYKNYLYLLIVTVMLSFNLQSCVTTGSSGGVTYEDKNTHVKVVFSDYDRDLIKDYYKKNRGKYPPGLAKKNKIPPGHEKQLIKKGKLPPGISKKMLPSKLEKKLTPLPDGYIRVSVGVDIVIMNEDSRVVMDVIYDVIL